MLFDETGAFFWIHFVFIPVMFLSLIGLLLIEEYKKIKKRRIEERYRRLLESEEWERSLRNNPWLRRVMDEGIDIDVNYDEDFFTDDVQVVESVDWKKEGF